MFNPLCFVKLVFGWVVGWMCGRGVWENEIKAISSSVEVKVQTEVGNISVTISQILANQYLCIIRLLIISASFPKLCEELRLSSSISSLIDRFWYFTYFIFDKWLLYKVYSPHYQGHRMIFKKVQNTNVCIVFVILYHYSSYIKSG